jgi:hypothetical protein
MGKEMTVAIGVLLCLFGMSTAVIIGFAASVGRADVALHFTSAVSNFLLGHWNLSMVAGPLSCTVVVYLGSFMIAIGIQPSPVTVAKSARLTDAKPQ